VTLNGSLKWLARRVATLLVLPIAASTLMRGRLLGYDRAFQASIEWMSALPGVSGQYLRRAYLAMMTEGCGDETVIGFGTLFSTRRVRIDANAYVGPQCDIGWAHIERDALVAAGVHIPSGPATHGLARLDVPMRDQPGETRCVHVREGAWVGNAAVVMADVGRHAVVAAGAVVTKPIPDYAIAAGVPAQVIRFRLPGAAGRT
jgi:virginiamycin A acetyltransferase